jgi:Uma2 family endonuclease
MTMVAFKRPREREVYYPEGDGKPIAETDIHRDLMVYFIEALKRWFEGQEVYVSGNILLYYEKGNSRLRVSPDTLVAFGLSPNVRRVYKLWEEGKAPDFVIEVTSKGTSKEDRIRKAELYARLGVREMWLVDPLREYLGVPFRGYELIDGDWQEIATGAERAHSRVLGLDIVAAPGGIWLARPNGELLPGPRELSVMLDRVSAELEASQGRIEAQGRELELKDARISQLEAELQRLRGRG